MLLVSRLNSGQHASLVTCALLVALGVVLFMAPKPQMVWHEASADLPVVVRAHAPLGLTLHSDGVYPKIRLNIASDAPIRFETGGRAYPVGPGVITAGSGLAYRGSRSPEGWSSQIILTPPGPESVVRIYPMDDAATLRGVDLEVVKYTQITTLSLLSPVQVRIVAAAGVLLLLFCMAAHSRSPRAAQWACTLFSIGFLALNEVFFTLAVVGLLSAMYALRRRVNDGKGAIGRLLMFILSAVAFMVLFKYLKAYLFAAVGNFTGMSILMPLGISYFVIRLIDIQLRWFRGQSLDFTYGQYLFYMFFPGTLLAGPIEGVQDFFDKRLPRLELNDYAYGVGRVSIGVFKKLILADTLLYQAIHGVGVARLLHFNNGTSVNRLILDPAGVSGGEILVFSLTGLLFAYIDFSAYSDIAIGASRLLGHRVRENFNFPLLARNIREFWQRWHMSLSEWSFRNAYFPLLIKTRNSYIPLYVTMMVIGLWHAPTLSWFSWAVHHATGMTVVAMLPRMRGVPRWAAIALTPVRIAMTVVFVSVGFLFVYFNDYAIGLQLYARVWLWLFTLGAS
jgi:alginate O-acetyltransferase complex protein AlgI